MEKLSNLEDRFNKLRTSTACPFAENAKIRYSPDWDKSISLDSNLTNIISAFVDFADTGIKEGVDLFVSEVREKSIIRSTDNLSGYLNKLLYEIHFRDVSAKTNFTEGIEKMEWDYVFNGIRFFIAVFASIYKPNHPRFAFNKDIAFVMFQPDATFDKYNINSQKETRAVITTKVMTLFEKRGFDYNIKLVQGSLKAVRYLKPLNPNGDPIEWWKNTKYL